VSIQVERIGQKGRVAPQATTALYLEIIGSGWQWDFKRRWTDTEDGRLEQHLTEIAINLLIAAEDEYRSNEVWSYQRRLERRAEALEQRERERLERIRRAEEARIAAKRAQERALLRLARDHDRAETIRYFVSQALSGLKQSEASEAETERWAAWALSVAADLDPRTAPSAWASLRHLINSSA